MTPDSPFVLETLEARRPRGASDPVAILADLSRGLAPAARRHLERALVRQLLDRGVRDRRRLAAALAELRRGARDAEAAGAAYEVVEQELRAAGESGDEPEAASLEELNADDGEDEGAFAGSDEAFDEPEVDPDVREECEAASDDETGAFEAEGFGDDEAGDAFESEEDDESPFRDEFSPSGDAEDEADADAEADRDDEAWAAAEAGDADEAEDPSGWSEVLAEAEVEDEDEDSGDDEAFDREGDDPLELESEVPDPGEIGRNLDAIQVSTRQVVRRQVPNPFDLNAVASANTPSKRAVFKALQKTWKELSAVEEKLAAGPKAATKAKLEARRAALVRRRDEQAAALKAWLVEHALDDNRDRRATRANLRKKKRLLATLRGKRHAAKAAKLRADIDAIERALPLLERSLRDAAAAYQPLTDVTQNHHEARVPRGSGSALVRLHDHVIAFATDTRLGLEGSAGGDTAAGVAAALDAAPIGADRRAILRLLSAHEGTFTNVNTWDRAVVTFGFIQWTTDAAGDGTLTGVMQSVRDAAPDAYRRCFQSFGLDLGRSGGRRVFKLTLPDGSQLLAGAAARRVQTSVKHVAALSAAGLDPAVQAAQIRVAVEDKIDGMLARTVSAGGQSARLRDLLTSEYGVAVLTDRATGTGEGGTRDAAQAGFAAYMKANPGADMSRAVDRQAAGARVLQALEALDLARAKSYAVLSHEPGSFTA